LAVLKRQIEESRVAVIFTELGTNPAVAETIGKETGARVVQITTHVLPEDGSYFTMMRALAKDLAEALKQ